METEVTNHQTTVENLNSAHSLTVQRHLDANKRLAESNDECLAELETVQQLETTYINKLRQRGQPVTSDGLKSLLETMSEWQGDKPNTLNRQTQTDTGEDLDLKIA
jgi:1,6-anhydro-N-acetylmuramate kinase